MATASYVIGLGSNRRHGRHGAPADVLRAAIAAIEAAGPTVARRSRIVSSLPIGPSDRRFANAAVRIESALSPPELLRVLKDIERAFGRRRGRRWAARVIDLDILAWSGGAWADARLRIPHAALHARAFALGPAAEIAPGWRHPRCGRTLRQLQARLARRAPRPPANRSSARRP